MRAYVRSWRLLPDWQRGAILLVAAAVALANIRQPFPDQAPLQHLPTVLLVLAAPPLLCRWPASNRSVACVVLFFLLHTLGGRYTYSNVPYDNWALLLTGRDLTHSFGLARNGYDRVVHLGFGLLGVWPFAEMINRYTRMSWHTALVTAFLFVGAASALYEIFEWLLTIVVAPSMAADYNGQQGDAWDSQKDMSCAITGALLACSAFWRGIPREA